MAAIFQTLLNGFSSMKMFEFRLKFHWNLFLRDQLTIFQHWFRSWFGTVQATSHYLNQCWLVYGRIYASLGLSELIHTFLPMSATFHHWYSTYNFIITSSWWSFCKEYFPFPCLTHCCISPQSSKKINFPSFQSTYFLQFLPQSPKSLWLKIMDGCIFYNGIPN